MKLPLFPLLLSLVLFSCHDVTKDLSGVQEREHSVFIDSTFVDTVKQQIKFISDKQFSNFKTPIEYRFFRGGLQTDSIIQGDFDMISWYSNVKDTIYLVAQVGDFETCALLVRFFDKKPEVFLLRAPHLQRNYFKVNKSDAFTSQIKVPPRKYKLQLSQIPDTTNKPIVFGHIDMESGDYYDKRDSLQQPRKIQMKFYFRSQFRTVNYGHAPISGLAKTRLKTKG